MKLATICIGLGVAIGALVYMWTHVIDPHPSQNKLAPHPVTSALAIAIESKPADRPRFERIYTAQLDARASIKIRMYTSYGGDRYSSAELDQPNGRWVTFDPDRVADKILDPLLVPIVEKYCAEIARQDKEFIASNPSEFTDESGTVWQRK
jgi:hypothetical protein